MDMNRDEIHALERKISAGEAVCVESKSGRNNYFMEIAGKLVLVGFDPITHRIVTALPDGYLRKIPPELVTLARARLLASVQQTILDKITSGAARLVSQRERYHCTKWSTKARGFTSAMIAPFGGLPLLPSAAGNQRQSS